MANKKRKGGVKIKVKFNHKINHFGPLGNIQTIKNHMTSNRRTVNCKDPSKILNTGNINMKVIFIEDCIVHICPISHIKRYKSHMIFPRRNVKWIDGYYYPAKILNIDGDMVDVKFYQDKVTYRCSKKLVEDFDQLKIGDIKLVKKGKNGTYYPAKILAIDGDMVNVDFCEDRKKYTCSKNLLKDLDQLKIGDVKFTRWINGQYYPAKILAIEDNMVDVMFCHDKTKYRCYKHHVEDVYQLKIGDLRQVKWKNGHYYPAKILAIGQLNDEDEDDNHDCSDLEDESSMDESSMDNSFTDVSEEDWNHKPIASSTPIKEA